RPWNRGGAPRPIRTWVQVGDWGDSVPYIVSAQSTLEVLYSGRLPPRRPFSSAAERRQSPRTHAGRWMTTALRILLVDDDRDAARLASAVLSLAQPPFEVRHAPDALAFA